ncbi:caspase-2-like [Liolophura sinensis]|uniref:caspase-2-like n=1 Tax=Liolophura sinensis TaxID=3198878 RepID=UPI00315966CE
MDTRHKDILVTRRPELVENLNMRDGLFTQLIARKVLSGRMVRTIQHGKTPDQQAEDLLNILPTRGPKAFDLFCESLEADDQSELVRLYLRGDGNLGKDEDDSSSRGSTSQKLDRSSPILIAIREDDLKRYNIQCYSKSTREKKEEELTHGNPPPFEENETRMVLKHYLSEPPPPYQLNSEQTLPIKSCTSVGSSSHNPSDVNRADSLDTMNKRPSTSSSHSNDMPVCSRILLSPRNIKPVAGKLIPDSEDEGIDLTDGPVNVRVERCERYFYLQNYKSAYPMNRIPRGNAIILNVNEVVGRGPRKGTDIDRDNMKNLLTQLDFDVQVYNDIDGLTAREMVEKLRDFSREESHYDSNCCIIVLLSHGEEGYIFGTDGLKIPMSGIFAMFDNANAPGLVGKPKIFFVQACRGGALDKGVSCDETDGGTDMTETVARIPSQSDMLICYPTQEGYYAWRNRDRGSWYIEGIVQIFMKYAKNEDICAMLNRVNHLVSKKLSKSLHSEMDQMTQMSEYKSTLRKPHFYFFPGIGSQ